MCRKLVVVNQLSLGARPLGWEGLALPKGELFEYTSKQLKDIIKEGKDEVYGLTLSDKDTLEFDSNFFTVNFMNKVHINSLSPMVETDNLINLFYIVIGTHKEKNETMYDVVSSRYERTSFNEAKIKTLLEMGLISGGATIDKDGSLVVAKLEKLKTPAQPKPTVKPEKTPVKEVKEDK